MRLVGYARISTSEQSLDAQRDVLKAAGCEVIFTDAGSGKTTNRPGLDQALGCLHTGDVLVVASFDRLGRSLQDLVALSETLASRSVNLRVLDDVGLDTTTAVGQMHFHMLGAFAEYERRLIGARTSAAMQAKIAAGQTFGRPDRIPADVLSRIVAERNAGATLTRIAENLDADEVPTAQGGRRWYASTVRGVLRTAAAA